VLGHVLPLRSLLLLLLLLESATAAVLGVKVVDVSEGSAELEDARDGVEVECAWESVSAHGAEDWVARLIPDGG